MFGVGLDVENSLTDPTYHAFVKFGDGSTQDILLPTVFAGTFAFEPSIFWGITSDLGISSIHFGDANGAPTNRGSLVIDNLTIAGTVPEPGTLALLGIALAGLGFSRRKQPVIDALQTRSSLGVAGFHVGSSMSPRKSRVTSH